jgi:hypothetical protein
MLRLLYFVFVFHITVGLFSVYYHIICAFRVIQRVMYACGSQASCVSLGIVCRERTWVKTCPPSN